MRHPNVVNFVGACHTPPNVCLVTEFCARGSLDALLHKSVLTLDLTKKVRRRARQGVRAARVARRRASV
eukprot:347546-Chlamydomonas_euryale.AAC.1